MVYGETGSYPVEISVKKRMVSYWIKLINGNENKFSTVMYSRLLHKMLNSGYESPWLLYIKKILDECGMSDVWISQHLLRGNKAMADHVLMSLERRLKDQFVQRWREDLDNHSSCNLYKKYKELFEIGKYLTCLDFNNAKALIRLRTNNNRLPVNTARYKTKTKISNTLQAAGTQSSTLCSMCSTNETGDEYHLIFKCDNP